MSASLNELTVAVEFLKQRGAVREGGTWMIEGHALASEPLQAARQLRRLLISRGPSGARRESGSPVWTR